MERPIVETTQTPDGDSILIFHDALDFEHAQEAWEQTSRFLNLYTPKKLIVDLRALDFIDSAGVATLRLLGHTCSRRGIEVEYQSAPQSAQYLLGFVKSKGLQAPTVTARPDFITRIGQAALEGARNSRSLVQFIGELVVSAFDALHRLRRFRWSDALYYTQRAGAEAMAIIFLLSFLLGLVMAFQAAVQLRQFGANIFVADLVSLALTRELSPVFTAVILAGRSGSAFAAELGTMKVNEEVDALTVMGFNITQLLVLPKVFALAVSGPLLTVWSIAAGLAGGIVVSWTSLDITPAAFMDETYLALGTRDLATGLIKSEVFAILVAVAGCFRGLQATQGADSVGRQTTSAVVSGIFLIILSDAVFTVLFHNLGW